ncbi:HAD family hydrolase [Halobacillus litoralis]|uniref:HAD family hydrolase n=1 Tax=Halobacillus litoralis TaxID=45668 RepID=UPI001CD56583|nr:HAD family hydrolase [Halobacillus litoralis]MCA0970258.1 HAD family hydrolase [Halobacillus litoralis]
MRAVIFDLDETLLNRDATVRAFLADQYSRHHEEGEERDSFISRFMELDQGGYVPKREVYAQLQREFDWVNDTVFLQEYEENLSQFCVPFEGTAQLLSGLFGRYKLGMITNGQEKMQRSNIQELGLDAYFDTILISETEGVKKPSPEIFERVCERLDVSPEQCVYIGDHPENDVAAAQAVGMKGYWKVNDRFSCHFADEYITSFDHLRFVLDAESRMTG